MATLQEILAEIQARGLQVENPVINGGRLETVPIAGKKGKPGRYRITERNGNYSAYFKDWTTGQEWKVPMNGQDGTSPLSLDDRMVRGLLAEKEHQDREKARLEAAEKVRANLLNLPDCQDDNPYLKRKTVPSVPGLKTEDGNLVIPIYGPTPAGEIDYGRDPENIISAQTITPDGEKRFFPGGRTRGGYFPKAGSWTEDTVCVCEGLATGITIWQATGHHVLVAFSGGNLVHVARQVRGAEVIICGDNDASKPDNPGLKYAREAAKATGARLAIPVMPEGAKGSDFNDLAAVSGLKAVRAAIEGAGREPERPRVREFDFIHVSELLANIRPTDWLIEPFLEAQSLAVIFGEPGAFKSFLTIAWGLCIATGAQWMGHEVKQGPVFSLIGEGHNGYAKRVAAWAKATGTDAGNAPFYISTVPAAITETESAMQVMRKIDKLTSIHGKPELVIIDTLNRNFGPGDENSTVDMSRFIGNLDYFIGNDFSRLIVHHTGHGDKTRARGSSALRGAVDAEYRLAKEGEVLTLYCEKMKDSAKFAPVTLRPILINIGGAINKPIDSYHLEKAEAPPQKEKRLPQAQQIALDALQAVAGDTGEAHLEEWRQEAYARGISASDKPDARQKAFVRAVSGLREAGRIDTRDDVYWIAGHSRT